MAGPEDFLAALLATAVSSSCFPHASPVAFSSTPTPLLLAPELGLSCFPGRR